MKRDIIWVDYSRMIGIWLVVFGHAIQRFPGWDTTFLHSVWDYIYLFHMPLFFVVSGYLFNLKQPVSYAAGGGKVWNSIVVPYLIYQLVFLPWAVYIHREDILSNLQWWKLMVGLVGGDGYNTSISYYLCLPCWFLICIIQLRLLFLFVKINKLSSIILVIFSFLFLFLRKLYHWDFYFCIDCTIMAIPYFLLGFYMRMYSIMKHMRKWVFKPVIIFASAVSVWIILKINGPAQMNGPSYGNILLVNYLAGIAGSVMVFLISAWLSELFDKREWIKVVSRNTLFIIFSHWLLLMPFGSILPKIIRVENGLLLLIIALSLSIIILYISKKWIDQWSGKYPVIFGKIKESTR